MKQSFLLLLLYSGTITTLTITADAQFIDNYNDENLLNCCIICGEKRSNETTLTNLCSQALDHSLCCKTCTPKLLTRGQCASCDKPFKTKIEDTIFCKNSKPEDFKARIIKERIEPATKSIETMQSSLKRYKRERKTISNNKAITYLENGITEIEKRKATWTTITTICTYAQAWGAMIEDPADESTTKRVGEILDVHKNYETQETIHLIGGDQGRLKDLLSQTEEALKHAAGSDGDVLPNLLALKKKTMALDDTQI